MPAITIEHFNVANDEARADMQNDLTPFDICNLASFIQRKLIIEDEMFAKLTFAEKDGLSYPDAEKQMKTQYGGGAGFIVLRIHLLNLLVGGFKNQDPETLGVSACRGDFNSIALKLAADIQKFHPDSCPPEVEELSDDARGAFIAHLKTFAEEYADFVGGLETEAKNGTEAYTGGAASFWPQQKSATPLSTPPNRGRSEFDEPSPGSSPGGPSE